jgi:hypothetical protein
MSTRMMILAFVVVIATACSRGTVPGATPIPRALATPGQVGPAVIPASWKQASWYVDPQNTSTCASDNNRTCSLSTCGTSGDGPCLTYQSIATRWGTYSPRLQQVTVVNYMSAPSSGGLNDPIYATPYPEQNNTYLGISCALGAAQQTSTGTITVVSSKVRTKGSSTLLTVTYPSGAAANNIAVNSTHASRAIVYATSGGSFTTSQPYAAANPASFITSFTEVDTWTTGDTVTTYAPIVINMPQFLPAPFTFTSGGSFRSGYVYNCNVSNPGNVEANTTQINSFVSVFESVFTSILNVQNTSGYQNRGQFILENSSFSSVNTPPGYRDITSLIVGGVFQEGGSINAPTIGGDVILGQTLSLPFEATDMVLGAGVTGGTDGIYIGSSAEVLLESGDNSVISSTPIFWGPGTLDVVGPARFTYASGAGAATATFANSTIQLNSQTSGACVNVLADAAAPTCNQTISNTNLDTLLGSNSGCVAMIGGASFCNYGQ